jgi:mannose-6-phosphate isomerase
MTYSNLNYLNKSHKPIDYVRNNMPQSTKQSTIASEPKLTIAESLASVSIAATEIRPWGSFTTLEEGQGYKIKRIEVHPGHRLSLQMHHHRSEHWIVVSGTAKVVCGDDELILSSNQSTYVPQCTPHRLENPGVIKLVLIEVQNGQYLGEDDIIRFQDDYSRQ